jgi:ABC-type polysaccharide/polyol phosphate transport system ATPase subunit
VILVSHDTGTVQKMCDSVAWLNKGELQDVGAAGPIIAKYINSFSAE